MRSNISLSMSNIIDCNKIPFPQPLGPVMIGLNGSLGATSYLDCLKSYYFTFIGFTIGVIIIINNDKSH